VHGINMAQEIKKTDLGSNTKYTLQSTTDSTTLTLSDDKFAEIMVLKDIVKELRRING